MSFYLTQNSKPLDYMSKARNFSTQTLKVQKIITKSQIRVFRCYRSEEECEVVCVRSARMILELRGRKLVFVYFRFPLILGGRRVDEAKAFFLNNQIDGGSIQCEFD